MSGAVDFVKPIVEAATSPVWIAPKAAFNLVTEGKNPIKDVGESVGTVIKDISKSTVEPFMSGLQGDKKPVPNIAVQDPNAVKAQNEAQRAAAVRQAQVDQMTSTPGRGGTILTDNYNYRT